MPIEILYRVSEIPIPRLGDIPFPVQIEYKYPQSSCKCARIFQPRRLRCARPMQTKLKPQCVLFDNPAHARMHVR